MQFILTDLRSCFKNTTNYKKRYDDFKDKKYVEIEIQEVITRIGVNVSKEPQLMYNLVDNSSLFTYDLIAYLSKLSSVKVNNGEKDLFLDKLSDGRLKVKNQAQALNTVVKIVENSVLIIYNIINSPREIYDKFVDKVLIYYTYNLLT